MKNREGKVSCIGCVILDNPQPRENGFGERMIGHGLKNDHSIVLKSDAIVEVEDEISSFELRRVVNEEEGDPVVIRTGFAFEPEGARIGELTAGMDAFDHLEEQSSGDFRVRQLALKHLRHHGAAAFPTVTGVDRYRARRTVCLQTIGA